MAQSTESSQAALGELRPGRSPEPGVPECTGTDGPRPGLAAAESMQHAVDVIFPAQALEERDEVQQLRVCHVIEPGLHRHLQDRV